MGFVSFKTMDTDESIMNSHSEFPTWVKIITPFGVACESCTNDGYLRFDGKDYFELLAEINGYTNDSSNPEYLRVMGLELFYNFEDSTQYPKVVSMAYDGDYVDLPHKPQFCPNQGYWDD